MCFRREGFAVAIDAGCSAAAAGGGLCDVRAARFVGGPTAWLLTHKQVLRRLGNIKRCVLVSHIDERAMVLRNTSLATGQCEFRSLRSSAQHAIQADKRTVIKHASVIHSETYIWLFQSLLTTCFARDWLSLAVTLKLQDRFA